MIKLVAFVAFMSAFVCAFYILGQSQNRWVRFITLALLCLLVYQMSTMKTWNNF